MQVDRVDVTFADLLALSETRDALDVKPDSGLDPQTVTSLPFVFEDPAVLPAVAPVKKRKAGGAVQAAAAVEVA